MQIFREMRVVRVGKSGRFEVEGSETKSVRVTILKKKMYRI